jgi:A/G-specific adenine glycosylase
VSSIVLKGQNETIKQLWRLAKYHTPNQRNAEYTQAIMDLGATSNM